MDDVELTKTICATLGSIDGWVWRETNAPYADDDVRVCYGALAPKPNKAVGVRVYGAIDEYGQPRVRRVQVRFRGATGDTAGADRLAGQAFPVLTELSRQGGISGIRRESVAPLGADGNRREERTDNYIIILDNQEALT